MPIRTQRLKMRWKIAATLAVLFALYLLVAFNLPSAAKPIVWLIGDKLDWESWRLGGLTAKNCGHVPIGTSAADASACVISCFQQKKPFRVRYETTSMDEASGSGIVGAPDGQVYDLRFLGGSPDANVHLRYQKVWIHRCPEPITFHKQLDWSKDTGMISCRPMP